MNDDCKNSSQKRANSRNFFLRLNILIFIGIILLPLSNTLVAMTFYVDNVKGNDRNDGSAETPFASIEHGLAKLNTSDQLEVINTGKPYQRPYPGKKGRGLSIKAGGTLGNPLIINGNGAVITGLSIVPLEKWQKKNTRFYALPFWPMSNMYKGYKSQNYWLDEPQIWWVNGQAAKNCKNAEALAENPGGFWWDKANKEVVFHLPENQAIEKLKIELPANYGFYITSDHVVVKNFYFIHSWNDGFDASGKNQQGVFKNCIAIDNCGQGFSCHGTSNIYYEDCAAIRCASSGSCDVHWCTTRFHRCIFMDNTFEAGIYTHHETSHLYSDCLIVNNRPFEQIWQRATSSQIYDNCVILGGAPDRNILTVENGTVTFKNCTLANAAGICEINAKTRNSLSMDNCLVFNMTDYLFKFKDSAQERVFFRGNLFARSPGIIIDDTIYNADNWEDYLNVNPQDKHSEWVDTDLKDDVYKTEVQLKNRYQRESAVGADLPAEVWTRYEALKKIKATPSGISFE